MAFTLKEFYIVFFAILVIIISAFLYKKAAGTLSISKLGPISLTFYGILCLSYIGSTLILIGKAEHSMLRYLRHDNIKTDVFFIISVLMIVFPLIIIILNKIFRYDPNKYQVYREGEVKIQYGSNIEFVTMVIASVVCILSVIFVFAKIGVANNPYLSILKGKTSLELAELRIDIANSFTGISAYIKNIFAVSLTPFISYIAYVYMRKTKEKKWIILFIILFIFSNLIVFYNLQKATIVIYWFNFIILSILFGDSVKTKYLVIFGIVGFICLNLMYIFIAKKTMAQIFTIHNPVLNRLFITTPTGFLLHMEVFTYKALPLAGASMPSIIGKTIFGFDAVQRSARLIMSSINFTSMKLGIAGVYNGLFLGEAFANFGNIGIIIAMIHVPIVFFTVNYIFTNIKKTPISLALFSYLTVNLFLNLHGGYADYVFNSMWLIAIVVAVAMGLFNKILSKIIKDKKELKVN